MASKRVLVAGSRNANITQLGLNHHLCRVFTWLNTGGLDFHQDHVTIVSGTARGIDRMGESFADEFRLEVDRFPANWNKYGKSAGFKRNYDMAESGLDLAIIFWDGKSRGTASMIEILRLKNIRTIIFKA